MTTSKIPNQSTNASVSRETTQGGSRWCISVRLILLRAATHNSRRQFNINRMIPQTRRQMPAVDLYCRYAGFATEPQKM